MGTFAIRLPEDMHERLNRLSQETARPKAYYIKAALEEYLDDLEDAYLAESTLERIKRGDERVLGAEEFWRGLDD